MNVFTYALNALGAGRSSQSGDDLREFLAQSAVRSLLEKTSGTNEDFTRSEVLLIFEIWIHHTWLLATNAALYCVADTRRQANARRLWRIARSDIESDGKLILQIGAAELTDRDSYLMIDGKRPRKFTKHLFEPLTIQKSIENMLRNAFQMPTVG